MAYTLANLDGSALNQIATQELTWGSLSASNGTLATGAGITVTAHLNITAEVLPENSYTNTVSFVNSSSGSDESLRRGIQPFV